MRAELLVVRVVGVMVRHAAGGTAGRAKRGLRGRRREVRLEGRGGAHASCEVGRGLDEVRVSIALSEKEEKPGCTNLHPHARVEEPRLPAV